MAGEATNPGMALLPLGSSSSNFTTTLLVSSGNGLPRSVSINYTPCSLVRSAHMPCIPFPPLLLPVPPFEYPQVLYLSHSLHSCSNDVECKFVLTYTHCNSFKR